MYIFCYLHCHLKFLLVCCFRPPVQCSVVSCFPLVLCPFLGVRQLFSLARRLHGNDILSNVSPQQLIKKLFNIVKQSRQILCLTYCTAERLIDCLDVFSQLKDPLACGILRNYSLCCGVVTSGHVYTCALWHGGGEEGKGGSVGGDPTISSRRLIKIF